METPKNYHISFFGNLPEQMKADGLHRDKIQYKPDALHFETKQQLMEFFEDPNKIAEHLSRTRVVKMMMDNHRDGKVFASTIQVAPYFQGDSGDKLWFDEMRDVDLGLPRITQKILTK